MTRLSLNRINYFIHDAWLLAQELMALGNEKMWDVIRDVWVEMLCFSAGRCRGYLHAKILGSGVWLLLSHAGMETFSDKLQRRQQPRLSRREPQDKQDGAPSPSEYSQSLKPPNHKEEENHDAPLSPQGEGGIVPKLEIVVSP